MLLDIHGQQHYSYAPGLGWVGCYTVNSEETVIEGNSLAAGCCTWQV